MRYLSNIQTLLAVLHPESTSCNTSKTTVLHPESSICPASRMHSNLFCIHNPLYVLYPEFTIFGIQNLLSVLHPEYTLSHSESTFCPASRIIYQSSIQTAISFLTMVI
ncbi:hypothetical protein CHS0354_016615 [Potamilus streckersoni]|uniref:Uncharacterized protein n=1 Tax=Potamilus streckersoni TaxID=2493646 RepID=A0AAE0WCN4_9BIVA|nr:hypothetical protein CHS0354_016615 [Potamilus streckersoni]